MRKQLIGTCIACMVGCLFSTEAAAWGERAQQSITAMAMQVIKGDYSGVFKPGDKSFERDVLLGATAGPATIQDAVPLFSDAETVQAIATEIQLMRDVRKQGTTSYFAYRMGVLSSLVANVMMPYGFVWGEEEAKIQRLVNADVDKNLDHYEFSVNQKHRQYIRDVQGYFTSHRGFYGEDKRLISDDYRRGTGYTGFLKEGGPAYFARAVEAVADVWHTVLRTEGDVTDASASRRTLTWYFVKEIEYLLKEKQNTHMAAKAYEHFAAANQDTVAAYEAVADLFYAYGGENGAARAVQEWRTAYNIGGPERSRIAKKLSSYYLREGEELLESGQLPGSSDDDLPQALKAFEQALDYDRTSQVAADRIQEAHVAIADRQERFQMTLSIIAEADKVREEAEKARLSGDFALAIRNYKVAIDVLTAVGGDFPEQLKNAKEGIRTLDRSINDVINDILESASQAIEQGDRASEENKYEEALSHYAKVPQILSVIPDDDPTHAKEKTDIIQLAQQKEEESKRAEVRYKEALAQQEAAKTN